MGGELGSPRELRCRLGALGREMHQNLRVDQTEDRTRLCPPSLSQSERTQASRFRTQIGHLAMTPIDLTHFKTSLYVGFLSSCQKMPL